MPGVHLDFLKNTSQRLASNKSLPLKQVEAMLLYGKPQHKAQVAQKVINAAYGLALNKATHHVLLTLIDTSDNLTRVQLLYAVRRKLSDLCNSPVGNVVVQSLLDKLPKKQRKEIAETFVLNAQPDEFVNLCENAFGNHVAQRLFDYSECVQILMPVFRPFIVSLSNHPFGMRVVAKCIDAVESGWTVVLSELMPHVGLFRKLSRMWNENGVNDGNTRRGDNDDEADAEIDEILHGDNSGIDNHKISSELSNCVDEAVAKLFTTSSESMVLTSFMRHPQIPLFVKDAICAHACEFVVDYLVSEESQTSETECNMSNKRNMKHKKSNKQTERVKTSQIAKEEEEEECEHSANNVNEDKLQTKQSEQEEKQEEEEFAMPEFGSATGNFTNNKAAQSNNSIKKSNNNSVDGGKGKNHCVRHIHTYVAIFEHGDDAQRKELWDALMCNSSDSHTEDEKVENDGNNNKRLIRQFMQRNTTIPILIAAVKYYDRCRSILYQEMFSVNDNGSTDAKRTMTIVEIATDPVRTLLLRTFIDVCFDMVQVDQREMLCNAANTLALNQCGSPVLQRMLLADSTGTVAQHILSNISSSVITMMRHHCGSFLIQALIQAPHVSVRECVMACVLEYLGINTASLPQQDTTKEKNSASAKKKKLAKGVQSELIEKSSSPFSVSLSSSHKLREMMSYSEGSRVLQRLIAYCSDEQLMALIDSLLTTEGEGNQDNDQGTEDYTSEPEEQQELQNEKGDESTTLARYSEQVTSRKTRKQIMEEERTKHRPIEDSRVIACALHQHGCFCIQALLRETRSRQLDTYRRKLMNELKPFVFQLATSPWAGRVVLETMMQSGSATLAEAMRNVIYLRAEQWLSEPPSSNEHKTRDNKRDNNVKSNTGVLTHHKRSRNTNSNSDNKKRHKHH